MQVAVATSSLNCHFGDTNNTVYVPQGVGAFDLLPSTPCWMVLASWLAVHPPRPPWRLVLNAAVEYGTGDAQSGTALWSPPRGHGTDRGRNVPGGFGDSRRTCLPTGLATRLYR